MKHFLQWLVVLGLALAGQARAADTPYSGKVVDSQGQPVAGAEVVFYQFSGGLAILSPEKPTESRTNTDSQGAFSFPATVDSGCVVAKKAGMAVGWKTWLAVVGDSGGPLVLTMPSDLAGTVVDENGQPVEGAEVSVSIAIDKEEAVGAAQPNILFGKAASDSFTVRTGADGRFRIENFPSGAQANLAAAKKGKAMRGGGNDLIGGLNALNYQSGKEDIKLTMEAAGNIEGKVVTPETGQGLAGVKVRLQGTGGGMQLPAGSGTESIRSGADGAFRLADVAAGTYQVIADFDGKPMPDWVAESDPITVAAGATTRDVQVRASKGGVLKVTVLSAADQKPVSGVNITPYNNSGRSPAFAPRTGDNGVAFLRLTPGSWNLAASKNDWSPGQQNGFMVQNGQTNEVEIQLTHSLAIQGTVRDPAGAPVAGAQVSIGPNYGGGRDAVTDANGHYELTWVKQNFGQNPQYSVTARSLEKKLAAFHDIDDTTTSLDLPLQPALGLTVKAEDANGKPITNATATVMLFSGNMAFPVGQGQTAPPADDDDQGRIRIEALPQGQKYSVNLTAKGYGSANAQVEATETQTTHYDVPAMVLPLANRKLAGRVMGADGKPAAGVMVQLNGEGQPNGSAKTDATGRFIFDSVCDGPVNLFANAMNANANAQTVGGDTNVVLRLQDYSRNQAAAQPEATIKGRVTDASGAPVAGTRVTLYPNYWGGDDVRTDANGRYSLAVQNPQFIFQQGNWTPSVVARNLERNLAVAHDIDEKTTNLDLRLEDGLTVSAKVEDAGGQPLKGATATIMLFSGMNSFQMGGDIVRADETGRVQIKALPRGQQYSINIAASGYGSSSKTLEPGGTVDDLAAANGPGARGGRGGRGGRGRGAQAGQTMFMGDTKTTSFDCGTFVLKLADRKLAGQVLGVDGKPVIGANVNIQGEGQPSANTRTDTKGHFAFAAVCEGPINLYANYQGGSGGNFMNANAQAQGGDTNVTVRFRANNNGGQGGTPVTTTGTIFGPTGAPAGGVSLVVLSQNGGMAQDVRSDDNGKFSISWDYRQQGGGGRGGQGPPKPLLVARDEERNLAASQEVDDKTTSVDLHLQKGLTLSGSVVDQDGAPLPRAQFLTEIKSGYTYFIIGRPGQQQNQYLNVDSHGAFSMSALPAGLDYIVAIICPGHASANKNLSAAETQTESLIMPAFTLKTADRKLEGKVVDASDQPVARAQVNFNGQGQPNGNTIADSSGHFSFDVCEGPITVFAYKQPTAGGTFLQGNVQAQGGDLNVVVKLGVNGRQGGAANQAPPRFAPLKQPPWTWASISTWPMEHLKLMIVLLGVQLAALVVTASSIVWVAFIRKP